MDHRESSRDAHLLLDVFFLLLRHGARSTGRAARAVVGCARAAPLWIELGTSSNGAFASATRVNAAVGPMLTCDDLYWLCSPLRFPDSVTSATREGGRRVSWRRTKAAKMQYFTKQELQGGVRYGSKCMVGNWNENVTLDEVRVASRPRETSFVPFASLRPDI